MDEHGNVTSTSVDEIRSTLVKLDEEYYRIRIDVTAEVAGRRYDQEPMFVTKYFNGKDGRQSIALEDSSQDDVVIEGHSYPTERRSFLIEAVGVKSRCSIWYSPAVPPYILKMTTSYLDDTGKAQREVEMDVTAVDMPHKVLSEIKTTSHIRIRERSYARGCESTSVEVQCSEVPGWVVSRSSKMLDKDARVVQRTTLELIDFEIVRDRVERSRQRSPRLRDRLRGRTRMTSR
jgi:hypothetical protein